MADFVDVSGSVLPKNSGVSRTEWFASFLADRGTRKPSMHTIRLTARTSTPSQRSSSAALKIFQQCRWATSQLRRCGGLCALRHSPRGRVNSAVLIAVECVVHLFVHFGSDSCEPDATRRPSQDHQDTAESAAGRFSSKAACRNQFGNRAAGSDRPEHSAPRVSQVHTCQNQ